MTTLALNVAGLLLAGFLAIVALGSIGFVLMITWMPADD
jgi:hypothetical protein